MRTRPMTPRSSRCSRTTTAAYTKAAAGTVAFDVVHPCGYKYKDWVDLGAMQPWDTSLIPNYSQLNPKLMESGVVDGQQYFVPLDWGFIAPLVNTDHVDVGGEESFGILFDDRYEGKISWVDTSNMMYIGGLFLGVADPFNMTDEELGAGPRLPRVEEAPRQVHVEPVVRLLARRSRRRRSGSGTRGRTPSVTPTRPG